MEFLCREISKIKEARGVFCWKEMKLFSKTMLGEGESSEIKVIDYSESYTEHFGKGKKENLSVDRVVENLRDIKYLHALIT